MTTPKPSHTQVYLTKRCPDCEVYFNESHVAGCSIGTGLFKPSQLEAVSNQAVDVANDYAALRLVLDEAYAQSACGKGKERHANNRPFEKQPILELSRMVGVGGPLFQLMKKAQEAGGMASRGEHDKAIHELLGSIVYASAAIVLLKELKNNS